MFLLKYHVLQPYWMTLMCLMAATATAAPQTIKPGEVWPDDQGKHIQAHGGGIIKVEGTYYWFGEDRRQGLDPNFRYVGCYASKDLVNWTNRKEIRFDRPDETWARSWVLERPKVYYNAKTKKYVMYMHLDGPLAGQRGSGYARAEVGVATCDTVDGDYQLVKHFRPLGCESRDIGQFVDDDGSAYLIFEDRPSKGFHIAKLSEDYLNVEKDVCLIRSPLEGGAVVHYQGLYYAIGSALTGWNPNPNKYATAKSLEGPWSEFKDIAPPETNTYRSQSTMMVKVAGTKTTTVIFMGDMWKPRTQWDSRYLWMPLEIGDGKLWLPEPKEWTLDIETGEAVIQTEGRRKAESSTDTMLSLPGAASVPRPAARVPRSSMDVTQIPNEKLDWLLDARFGMFIHWGLYSGPGRGEWFMENQGLSPERYRQYASPESGDAYFDAADYHPEAWAQLAKDAGMKWMCMTARHHDGFCLFDSPHPNAFTSMQTLHRDLIAEYVKACRGAGLKVGIYYSPLSWRYPGYYDVNGTNCLPNKFGYTTDPSHAGNARLMKEENYVNVKKLLTGYGRIDHIFWDGGWLGQRGSDADGAHFHEPGRYLDPANRWPIPREYQDLEEGTGKALGIMGMVRKYQPEAITNPRYGWIGDIADEEGSQETTGKIRSSAICNKCLTLQNGGWGYNAESIAKGNVMTRDQLVRYLANCVVRNMTLLVNVTPDRHGVIPELEQQRLREMGAWMTKMGDAIYGTRGGPWEPVDRQYGYCYKGSTIFVHLLPGYPGTTFNVPPLGGLRVKRVYEVYTGKPLSFQDNGGVAIRDIDRTSSPADSVVAIEYTDEVRRVWAN